MDALTNPLHPIHWEAVEAVGTWVAAIGTLAAVFLALWFALRDRSSRRVERRGEITAMLAEVFRARLSMQTLLREDILAPLYRLPIANFDRALPKLIGDGRLEDMEIDVLVEYGNRIEELNRGLERAGDAHSDGARMVREFKRNRAKALEILEEKSPRFGDRPLIDAAQDALFRMEDVYASRWYPRRRRPPQ